MLCSQYGQKSRINTILNTNLALHNGGISMPKCDRYGKNCKIQRYNEKGELKNKQELNSRLAWWHGGRMYRYNLDIIKMLKHMVFKNNRTGSNFNRTGGKTDLKIL
uniref:Uncharacterized protein n=1 Tax=Micrurus lemniscatus lemniscatus TaxID=129467 RepID=A0A2D4IC81_MICLE